MKKVSIHQKKKSFKLYAKRKYRNLKELTKKTPQNPKNKTNKKPPGTNKKLQQSFRIQG